MSGRDLVAQFPELPHGVPDDARFWEELHERYGTGSRHYHTLGHVVDVAVWFEHARREVGWQQEPEVFVAVLFHDVVYQAGADDNERRSAEVARSAIERWSAPIDADRVAALIELTASHGRVRAVTLDADAAMFLDCDMAILGSSPAVFDEYERAIEREHDHLEPAVYRAGRRSFLSGLLALEHVFLSSCFQDWLEQSARDNIRRSLRRLEG